MPVECKLFTSDAGVRNRLNRALESDPDHIVPGDKGDHVAKIQIALSLLGKVSIDDSEIKEKRYGKTTATAVKDFKARCSPPLLNYQNALDDITGKKTTRELDRQMKEFERGNPVPPTPPSPAGPADVQIGPLGPRGQIVTSYYQNCAYETIGPARLITTGLRSYSTFEGLLDLLITRTGLHHVIVNHGGPTDGLLVPWCAETTFRATGDVIKFFTKVAEAIEAGTANKNNNDYQDSVDTIKFFLNVSEQIVLRIAQKLVFVRQRPSVIHLRACNLQTGVALNYKQAFRSLMITFHSVRLLYLRIKPVRFAPGHSPSDFPFTNNTTRDRARVFFDPLGLISTLVVAVRDLDGHTNVFDFSFVERLVPSDINEWAQALIGRWQGSMGEFVLPVMWDNTERTWDCPAEDAWRSKLRFV
jgi:hypothetical protein